MLRITGHSPMYDIFYVSKKTQADNQGWLKIKSEYPTAQKLENIKSFDQIQKKAFTKMFWVIWDDIELTGDLDLSTYIATKWDDMYIHVFPTGNSLCLFPKNVTVTQKEYDSRYFNTKKEVDVRAAKLKPFEKFSFGTYKEYLDAFENSKTDLFWHVPKDVTVVDSFDLDNIEIPHLDKDNNHTFLNGKDYDGVVLFSKDKLVSEREFNYRFYSDAKVWEVLASTPKPYDIFYIDTFEEYQKALENSTTEMFWMTSKNLKPADDFKFDIYISHHNSYERRQNHAFIHRVNGKDSYNGIFLCSKQKSLTKKEIEYRFPIERKEWNIVGSGPVVYTIYQDKVTYQDYLTALEDSPTELFWFVPNDVDLLPNFKFDLYFTVDNIFDREMNHTMLNGKSHDGVTLFSKKALVSKREFDHRYFMVKKEWDIQASTPKPFEKFEIKTYQDYLDALKNSKFEMVWIIPDDVNVLTNFNFNQYISHHDTYDRRINHMFLNGEYNDGIMLCSKKAIISEQEFFTRKISLSKDSKIFASTPKQQYYDIVFISYNEPNAEENYNKLLNRYPNAKRVHKVKGIHQAHIAAAKLTSTPMFWVVDGDAEIIDDFEFDYTVTKHAIDAVHVWQSQNPINNLVYGYGGVKLLPTELTIKMNINSTDMTTSISKHFKSIPKVSNITAFNTDPFSTWKSAFRECVKLSSRTIDRHEEDETQHRLDIWCNEGSEAPYGKYAIEGAKLGRQYGEKNSKTDDLKVINDFDWLLNKFTEIYGSEI